MSRNRNVNAIGKSKAFFESAVGRRTLLMLANYLQRGLYGRAGLIQAAYDRLQALMADPDSKAIDRHWAYGDLCSKSIMLFDDLGAALWAGDRGTLAEFGRNLVRCQQGDVTEIFEAAVSSTQPERLARGWGFPPLDRLGQARALSKEDLDTVRAVKEATVRELAKELRRIGRLRERHVPLYNKHKHALAAVLVDLRSDDGQEGMAVIKDPNAEAGADAGHFYP